MPHNLGTPRFPLRIGIVDNMFEHPPAPHDLARYIANADNRKIDTAEIERGAKVGQSVPVKERLDVLG